MKAHIFIQGLFPEKISMKSERTVALASLQWKDPPTTGRDTVTLASRERSCDNAITLSPFQWKGPSTGNDTVMLVVYHQKGLQTAFMSISFANFTHSQSYAKLCEQRTCDQPLNNSLELNETIFQSSIICVDVNEIITSPSSIDLTTSSVKQNKSKYPLKEAGNIFSQISGFLAVLLS